MKSTPTATLYDLPLSDLRMRAARARDALKEVQSRVSNSLGPPASHRAGTLKAIDDVLRAVDRLMPGLRERPNALLARTIGALAPHERAVLRQAIEAERAARERLARLLGDVSPAQAEDILARVEVHESVAIELSALFRIAKRAYWGPTLRA